MIGWLGRARTCDILVNSEALYLLSYKPVGTSEDFGSGAAGPESNRQPRSYGLRALPFELQQRLAFVFGSWRAFYSRGVNASNAAKEAE